MKHSIQRRTDTLVSGELISPARTTKMADYDLICRERMEDELTCSCKTKCGVFSDVQVMEDGSVKAFVLGCLRQLHLQLHAH